MTEHRWLFHARSIRDFAAEMQASHGDDLGPMIWRDVQRLAESHMRLSAVLYPTEGEEHPMDRDTAEKYLRQWKLNDVFLQFFRALQERDGSDFDAAYFLDRPEKWADDYVEWVKAGKPEDASEAGWEAFEAVGIA